MKHPALLTSGWWNSHGAARHPSRDDQSFATVDADGVALAAIQGLNQKLEAKDARIDALEKELTALKEPITKLSTIRN